MRWVVDIGYPNGSNSLGIDAMTDNELEGIAQEFGAVWESGGSGFGIRDIQFAVSSKAKAIALADRFVLATGITGTGADILQEKGYISLFWEPKSLLLYMISVREYKDALHELWGIVNPRNIVIRRRNRRTNETQRDQGTSDQADVGEGRS
jgi:hypothetical protein